MNEHDLQNLLPVGAVTAAALAAQNPNSNPQSSNGGGSGSSGRSTPNNLTDQTAGKLFVGGLSWQTSAEKLREYFGMFGTVTDVLIMKDPITQVSLQLDRAKCFVNFVICERFGSLKFNLSLHLTPPGMCFFN